MHGRPTFGVLVFDYPADNSTVLVGWDRTGWLVWFFAPQIFDETYSVNGPMVQLTSAPSSSSSSSLVRRVAVMVDESSVSATLKVIEATMTNQLIADWDAPCAINDATEPFPGRESEGGCLTHELEDDGTGGVLTYRSIVRKVDGLEEDADTVILASLPASP